MLRLSYLTTEAFHTELGACAKAKGDAWIAECFLVINAKQALAKQHQQQQQEQQHQQLTGKQAYSLAPEEGRASGAAHFVASPHYPVSPKLLHISRPARHRLATIQQNLGTNLRNPPGLTVRLTASSPLKSL